MADEALFEKPAEEKLYLAVQKLRNANKMPAWRCLLDLQLPITQFFDEVMVMVDNSAVRANRMALLSLTKEVLKSTVDWTLITSKTAPQKSTNGA